MTNEDHKSPGDDLLRWVSEVGAGSWGHLRDASAYLCNRHELRLRPSTLASALSSLGHVDIDWTNRRWSVAPPALNLVPGLGLCIVLTGSRPYYLDRRFDEATDNLDVYRFEHAQPPAPAAKFAKCASVEVAERVAERMDADLVVDPADTLMDALNPINEELLREQAPPPPVEELQRFEPTTLRWGGDSGEQPGLYRFDLHGRLVHRHLDQHGSWWEIELPVGQFLALRARRDPVVRWRPPMKSRPACFEVRSGISLPIVAERAATISTGLMPTEVDGWRRFLNVSKELAHRIADALMQDLDLRTKRED